MALEVERLQVTVTADTGDFERAMGRVRQESHGLGSTLQGAIGTAAGFALAQVGINAFGGAISAAKGAVIGFNDQLDRAKIGFTAMMGSAEQADRFVRQLLEFARTTPFEFKGLLESSQLLMNFKFQANDVIPILTAIGDKMAASGRTSEEAIQRVVIALGQMNVKGKVSAEEMLQLTEAGVDAWGALANAMGVTTGEAQKMVEKGLVPADKAIRAILIQMEKDAPGAMDKMSASWATATSNIRDSLTQLTAQAFRPFFNLLTDMANQLAKALGSEPVRRFAAEVEAALGHLTTAMRALFRGDMSAAAREWDAFAKIAEVAILRVELALVKAATAATPFASAILREFINLSAQLAVWGMNLMASLASGIVQGGVTYVVAAAQAVAEWIAAFFRSLSPPKQGPLRDIDVWGTNLIRTLLEGMERADLSALETVARTIRDKLQAAVSFGEIGELDVVPRLVQIQALLGDVLDTLARGESVADAWWRLMDAVGGVGAGMQEFVAAAVNLAQVERELDAVNTQIRAIDDQIREVNRAWEDAKRPIEDAIHLTERYYNTLIENNNRALRAIQARVDAETAAERAKLAAMEPALAEAQLAVEQAKLQEAQNAPLKRRQDILRDITRLEQDLAKARRDQMQDVAAAEQKLKDVRERSQKDLTASDPKVREAAVRAIKNAEQDLANTREDRARRVADLEQRLADLRQKLEKEGVETAQDRLAVLQAERSIVEAQVRVKQAAAATEKFNLEEQNRLLQFQKDEALAPLKDQLDDINESHQMAVRILEENKRPLEDQKEELERQRDALSKVIETVSRRARMEREIGDLLDQQRRLLEEQAGHRGGGGAGAGAGGFGGPAGPLELPFGKPPEPPKPINVEEEIAKARDQLRAELDKQKGILRDAVKEGIKAALSDGLRDAFKAVFSPEALAVVVGGAFGAAAVIFSGGSVIWVPVLAALGSAAALAALHFGEKLGEGLVKIWPKVKDALGRMWQTVVGAMELTPIVGPFVRAFEMVGGDIVGGIAKGLKAALGGLWTVIKGAITGLIDLFKFLLGIESPSTVMAEEVGKPLIEGLWKGAKAAWDAGIAFLTGLARRVIEAVGDLSETLLDHGKDLIDGLWKGAKAVWEGAKGLAGWLTDRAKAAAEAVGDLTETLLDHGKALLQGLWQGAKAVWEGAEGVAGWLGQRATQAASAVGDLASTLLDHGKALIGGLLSGAKSLWDGAGGVVEWLGGIAGRALAAVGDLSRTLWNAGVDLIQGLINGIRSKLSDLGGVLSGVTSFIRDHKGPEERDRRLLEPAGQILMTGLARGMLAGLDEVDRATRLVTDRLTTGLSPVTVAGAAGSGAALAGTAPAGGGTTVIVQVQGPVYGFANFQQAVVEAVREGLRTRALSVR